MYLSENTIIPIKPVNLMFYRYSNLQFAGTLLITKNTTIWTLIYSP